MELRSVSQFVATSQFEKLSRGATQCWWSYLVATSSQLGKVSRGAKQCCSYFSVGEGGATQCYWSYFFSVVGERLKGQVLSGSAPVGCVMKVANIVVRYQSHLKRLQFWTMAYNINLTMIKKCSCWLRHEGG